MNMLRLIGTKLKINPMKLTTTKEIRNILAALFVQWEGDIMGWIREYDYDRAVEKERADKKAAALNKLTAEEREILGVK